MGLLDFLFGGNKRQMKAAQQPTPRPASAGAISFHDNFVEIPSIGFFGQFSKSHSGEWVLCWSDSDEAGQRGGHRDSGKGRYVLYSAQEKAVVLQGKLERPNSGNAADNGNFSIEDWHFGSELSGTFYVFSSDGKQLTKKQFNANLYNSAISDSGRYAICQTANSPVGEDGNRLTAFDVEGKAQLFSIHPPTGWADEYRFEEGTSQIGVVINGIGTFHYDMQGQFVDSERFGAARLQSERYDVALMAAEEILKATDLNEQRAKAALDAATRACGNGADNDQGWKAVALKVQGLAHEFLQNNEKALAAFDQALAINPKIGVKRKADSLRKKLAT